jgi:hypothetical protein
MCQGTTSVVPPWAFGPPKWMKTLLRYPPRRGRRRIAQGQGPREQVFVRGVEDKRSAVLGKANKKPKAP